MDIYPSTKINTRAHNSMNCKHVFKNNIKSVSHKVGRLYSCILWCLAHSNAIISLKKWPWYSWSKTFKKVNPAVKSNKTIAYCFPLHPLHRSFYLLPSQEVCFDFLTSIVWKPGSFLFYFHLLYFMSQHTLKCETNRKKKNNNQKSTTQINGHNAANKINSLWINRVETEMVLWSF